MKISIKPVIVQLSADQPERIDKLVGKHQRSVFIRDSVEQSLKKIERKNAEKKEGEE